MHGMAYTVLKGNTDREDSRIGCHPMLLGILVLFAARMLAAHSPVWHVAKEVDTGIGIPVVVCNSVHSFSSNEDSLRHVEHVLEAARAESRIWQRQKGGQVVRHIDGITSILRLVVLVRADVLQLIR